MTTAGFTTAPPPPPSAPQQPRALRRSRTDRVGAGVAGGLGNYFDVDPVLFRVLFATAAFFGGVGILAYLLAWAAIPEEGTAVAAVDGWIRGLRERKVPVWVVAVIVGLGLWLLAFSWWAPGPFFPALIVAIVLVAVASRRRTRIAQSLGEQPYQPDRTVPMDDVAADPTAPTTPSWVGETRLWIGESRVARRERRRRTFPIRVATFGALVVVLGILGAVDAGSHNIAIPALLWCTLGILTLGLFAGVVTRRTPWSLTPLIILTVALIIGFGHTSARLSDGFGNRELVPTTAPASSYRLAFGQIRLDLRHIPTPTALQTVDVTMAAGHVDIIAPPSLNVTVVANVHIGSVEVDTDQFTGSQVRGFNVQRIVEPAAGATGAPLTVVVHLSDGQVSVTHSN